MSKELPLLILAGSDRRRGPVPRALSEGDMLTGTKGALELPWGRCLAAEVVERYRNSDRFADPILVGPAESFGGRVDCEIVDVSGNLATTLQRSLKFIQGRFDPDEPLAVSTCDILPTAMEIRELIDNVFEPHRESSLWWQLSTGRSNELGASAWKPYYVLLDDGAKPVTIYPGHLVVLRPARLRLELLNGLLAAAYRSRNRSLRQRFLPMLLRGLGLLMKQDLLNIARLQLPILTCTIPWHLLQVYFRLGKERLTWSELEWRAARVLVHRRDRGTGRPVVFSPTNIAAFVKDIDTVQELEEAIERGPDASTSSVNRISHEKCVATTGR